MATARIDPALGVRVIRARELHYSDRPRLGEDRPAHVRAASGLAFSGGRLAVVQDDAAFIAMVAGNEVAALVLPRGAGGRRRFEVELGNKHEKLDLEACVAIGDDLFAFGSGSTDQRERIVHVGFGTKIFDAALLYRRLREEVGSANINIEGVALLERELWMFHRGNTGPGDPGPTVVAFPREPFIAWLRGTGILPEARGARRYELGSAGGVRLGFTDAVAVGSRVYYIAAAEDSPNAIDDGAVTGSQLGVIDGDDVRAMELVVDGKALKAEGLAFDPANPRHVYVAIDPDDTRTPASLYELELVGPW